MKPGTPQPSALQPSALQPSAMRGLTKLEVEHIVVICRKHRDKLRQDKLELQERHRAHVDGDINDALLALDNELFLLTGIVSKLWKAISEEGK